MRRPLGYTSPRVTDPGQRRAREALSQSGEDGVHPSSVLTSTSNSGEETSADASCTQPVTGPSSRCAPDASAEIFLPVADARATPLSEAAKPTQEPARPPDTYTAGVPLSASAPLLHPPSSSISSLYAKEAVDQAGVGADLPPVLEDDLPSSCLLPEEETPPSLRQDRASSTLIAPASQASCCASQDRASSTHSTPATQASYCASQDRPSLTHSTPAAQASCCASQGFLSTEATQAVSAESETSEGAQAVPADALTSKDAHSGLAGAAAGRGAHALPDSTATAPRDAASPARSALSDRSHAVPSASELDLDAGRVRAGSTPMKGARTRGHQRAAGSWGAEVGPDTSAAHAGFAPRDRALAVPEASDFDDETAAIQAARALGKLRRQSAAPAPEPTPSQSSRRDPHTVEIILPSNRRLSVAINQDSSVCTPPDLPPRPFLTHHQHSYPYTFPSYSDHPLIPSGFYLPSHPPPYIPAPQYVSYMGPQTREQIPSVGTHTVQQVLGVGAHAQQHILSVDSQQALAAPHPAPVAKGNALRSSPYRSVPASHTSPPGLLQGAPPGAPGVPGSGAPAGGESGMRGGVEQGAPKVPLAIFWDIENCSLPADVPADTVACSIRDSLRAWPQTAGSHIVGTYNIVLNSTAQYVQQVASYGDVRLQMRS